MQNTGPSSVEPGQPPRVRRRRGQPALRLTIPGLLLLLILNGAVCSGLAWLGFQYNMIRQPIAVYTATPTNTATIAPVPTFTETPTLAPSATETLEPTLQPSSTPLPANPVVTNPLIFSLQDQGFHHLFAYQPLAEGQDPGLPPTRLTSGLWDDVSPVISPDGSRLAFASNRSGYWDIYILDLRSGETTRVTDTLEYDNHPSWSPDGQWLVFETYLDGSLEVIIRSAVDTVSPPIRLTTNSFADYQPAWSPQGRSVAFVSDRSGIPQIYMVDLNQVDETLVTQISVSEDGIPSHPAWSEDGTRLAWSEARAGAQYLLVKDFAAPDRGPAIIGRGDYPIWGLGDRVIFSVLHEPNLDNLIMYYLGRQGVMPPPVSLGVNVEGLSWGASLALQLPLPEFLAASAAVTVEPLYRPALVVGTPVPGGRQTLIELENLRAPYPMLQDRVDEAFEALRRDLRVQIGWDFLSTLENAYVPLTAALIPGAGESWLYTGRSFAFNSQYLDIGWVLVVREDIGQETYWRIYLKPVYQDGSAGRPLTELPWDFTTRFRGDVLAYEQGGSQSSQIPPGYWFDFTAFALQYNWQRLPALPTWISAYPQARFNEFVLTDGLSWNQAMGEIYPPEVFITPSPILPPTQTPRPTSRWFQSPTPTITLTPRPTHTPPPTLTPTGTSTATRTFTSTATRTATPRPSVSPTSTRTASPTVSPTASPTTQPTAAPSATPTP